MTGALASTLIFYYFCPVFLCIVLESSRSVVRYSASPVRSSIAVGGCDATKELMLAVWNPKGIGFRRILGNLRGELTNGRCGATLEFSQLWSAVR